MRGYVREEIRWRDQCQKGKGDQTHTNPKRVRQGRQSFYEKINKKRRPIEDEEVRSIKGFVSY